MREIEILRKPQNPDGVWEIRVQNLILQFQFKESRGTFVEVRKSRRLLNPNLPSSQEISLSKEIYGKIRAILFKHKNHYDQGQLNLGI